MALDLEIYGIPAFYVFMAVCLILPRIPVAGKYFSIINTGIHELGHALMTLLLDGRVIRVELRNDTSGITASSDIRGKLAAFLVAVSGYTAASAAALLAARLMDMHLGAALLTGLTMTFFVMLVFWTRNAYGIVWTVSFCALNCYLIYTENRFLDYFALFCSTLMLTESFFSAFEQLLITIRKPSTPCDATNLAKITGIPSVIWSFLFVALAALCCYLAVSSI